ncbi:MAG: class I SAM-dependent methyltransferase [Alphaproteobacteria bacterium]|nr:class I SAM-dependent methyltransferase [Alphaproteobacteria bacterium]
MTASKDPVQAQYETWVYPLPIQDLAAPGERTQRDLGDPQRNWITYWPAEPVRDDLDILIAGCGANAAARYAFHNRRARVTGIDLSAASVAHEQVLKDKHGLTNLTLHQGRLEDVASCGQTFDFIESSGVLHHLPDPAAGLRALGQVLRPNGTIAIMLYGVYPRLRFHMLRDLFQMLGVGQTPADVAFVRRALELVPEAQTGRDPAAASKDLSFDAGIVDTMLHPQDRAYTVQECLDLTRDAGLSFMGWWDNNLRYPEGHLDVASDLYGRMAALPEEEIWKAMELYLGLIGQHSFCVCHASRPTPTYQVDFTTDAFLAFIPVRRSQEAIPPPQGTPPDCIAVQRGKQSAAYVLNAPAAALYRQVDGRKSIGACLAGADTVLAGHDPKVVGRSVFTFLWRVGYIFVRLPPA